METPNTNRISLEPQQQNLDDHTQEAGTDDDQHDNSYKLVDLDQLSLPKETIKGSRDTRSLYFYQNFWCPSRVLRNLLNFQDQPFQAQPTDLVIVTKPKSGTTWLKALAFAIANRGKYRVESPPAIANHPLLTANPHDLVLSLELFILNPQTNQFDEFSKSPPPRIYSAHLPYHALPDSVKDSGCKIVYLCRNPLDTIVSLWHFVHQEGETEEESLQKRDYFVDSYCRGVDAYGPHWDHVLGYWKESLAAPHKVLFMRYEKLKEDHLSELKRLAEFMGCPFTSEEEGGGVVEGIAQLCSFQSLKDLDIGPVRHKDIWAQGRFLPAFVTKLKPKYIGQD